jgi:hypothetical protein
MTDLTPSAADGRAYDIDNLGQVVGSVGGHAARDQGGGAYAGQEQAEPIAGHHDDEVPESTRSGDRCQSTPRRPNAGLHPPVDTSFTKPI